MSQIKLQGNASGTGAFTIASPNSNTDRTLNLPDADGTLFVSGQNPTLSAGTANGVAYLNGSKVLTTGSALVFDGSNLGIGTSSPGAKLELKGSAGSSVALRLNNAQASNNNRDISVNSSGIFQISRPGVADDLLLDTSGNLGLGVTPSAWNSGYKVAEIGKSGTSVFAGTSSGNVIVASNAYLNASDAWTYANNGGAAYFAVRNSDRSFVWNISSTGSGTAGNAISFTQAMTLDASGNLLLGATSAGQTITVSRGAGVAAYIQLGGNGTADPLLVGSDASGVPRIFTGGSAPITLWTNGTERARIDSSGRFLVGRTSTRVGEFASFTGSPADGSWTVEAVNTRSSGTPCGVISYFPNLAPNNTTSLFFQGTDGTTRFEVRSNGGIANYSGNNVNLSDRREKTNFAPAGSYLDKICAIPVQTFNYIDQNLEEDDGLTLGVVAQDVQAVAPELVMESNWGTEENPKMRLSIYQTDLQYALMKCIQELKAEIDALKGAQA